MINYSLQKHFKGKYGYWYIHYSVHDSFGHLIRKQKSTGVKALRDDNSNLRVAQAFAYDFILSIDDYSDVVNSDILFSDYVYDWIRRSKFRVQISTFNHYEDMYFLHIKPYFYSLGLKIKDVKPLDIEKFYSFKLSCGLSPNTVIKFHSVLRSSLQDAVKNSLIKRNPADFANKPKRVKSHIDVYSVDDFRKLWIAVRGSKIEVPCFLALVFGLRKSECLGLQWSDIDLNNRIMYINHKALRVKLDGKYQMIVNDVLKTDSSYNYYILDDFSYNYFVKLRQDSSYSFLCVDDSGKLLSSDYVTSAFSKILKCNGLKLIPFKNLRSSCLTAISQDPSFSVKQLQGYARHANFNTTFDIYCQDDRKITSEEMSVITRAIF